MYDEPAEEEEDNDARPEDALVLLRPSLDHADGVATDAQRVRHGVQPLLCALEHLPLVAEIAQHGPAAIEELVELVRRVLEEGVFAQHAALAVVLAALLGAGRVCVGPVGGVGVVGLGCKGRVRGGGGGCVGQRVRVLGRGGVVWAAAEQFCARLDCLLYMLRQPCHPRVVVACSGNAPHARLRSLCA